MRAPPLLCSPITRSFSLPHPLALSLPRAASPRAFALLIKCHIIIPLEKSGQLINKESQTIDKGTQKRRSPARLVQHTREFDRYQQLPTYPSALVLWYVSCGLWNCGLSVHVSNERASGIEQELLWPHSPSHCTRSPFAKVDASLQ